MVAGCKCKDKKSALNSADVQNDSLRAIIDARDNEINDMMSTLNDIQQGFSDINAAENRVTIAKDGERADKAAQVKENIQFIAQRMKENRELIKKLQQQLRETGFKGEAMRKTLAQLTTQLGQKEAELRADFLSWLQDASAKTPHAAKINSFFIIIRFYQFSSLLSICFVFIRTFNLFFACDDNNKLTTRFCFLEVSNDISQRSTHTFLMNL